MIVKEFLTELDTLREQNPNLDEMEIGPIFDNNGEVIMLTTAVRIVKDCSWEDQTDVVGIEWMT